MRDRFPRGMLGSRTVAAALGLSVLAAAPVAVAQTLEKPRPRQGYYLGGGFHNAVAHVTESGESLGVWPGMALTIRTGEMLTRHLGLGLFMEYGSAGQEPEFATIGGLGLGGQWEVANNLALHAGVGFGVVGLVDLDHPDELRRGSYGGSYSLGVSYDWFPRSRRLSGGWALQPIATLRFLPGDAVSTVFFTFGGEVIRWRGLPRNELDLPPGEGYEKGKRRR